MATQEKLLKSIETLKNLISTSSNGDSSKKKEKFQHCSFITEAISNPTIKIAPTFINLLSFSIEILLKLCDDSESDVRMYADECLNKIIRSMNKGNIGKVQIELHKEIKKNGAARSLRAAFSRFSQLAHLIKPHKGKAYVINLVPSIVKLSERDEDIIHEMLGSYLPKIMTALGSFTTDNDIKILLKAFLNNINTSSAVKRRTIASCLLTICLNCRKPFVFITYVLNILIDYLVPLQECQSTALILSVLGCLKTLLPYMQDYNKQEATEHFMSRKDLCTVSMSIERLLQIYELCLHYTSHNDHNVINSALETLNALLTNCPSGLDAVLLSEDGITESRINQSNESTKAHQRSPSQSSVATTNLSGDDILDVESELTDTIKSDIERWIDESKLSVINVTYAKTESFNKQSSNSTETQGSSFENIEPSEYSNIAIGTITDNYPESIKSESLVDNLDKLVLSDNSSEKSTSNCAEDKCDANTTDTVFLNNNDINIGEFCDKSVPLIYCTRHITKSFLLTGKGCVIPDKFVRVSVKSLALSCLSTIFEKYPKGLLLTLEQCAKNSSAKISDILNYAEHSDPQLRGLIRVCIGNFLKAVLSKSESGYEAWINANNDQTKLLQIDHLLKIIYDGLEDESANCSRQSLIGLHICMSNIINSVNCSCLVFLLNKLPNLATNPYWLVKVKLLELISDIDFMSIQYITESNQFQKNILYDVLFKLLKDDDKRVRSACSNSITRIISLLYFKEDYSKELIITQRAAEYRTNYLSHLSKFEFESNVNKKNFVNSMPFPFNSINTEVLPNEEKCLSQIVLELQKHLLISTSKYEMMGIIETLSMLSDKYPPTTYKYAWGCYPSFSANIEKNIHCSPSNKPISEPSINISSSEDLLTTCISLLSQSVFSYDFHLHLNLLNLTGNLYSGKCIYSFKENSDLVVEENKQLWSILSDKTLMELSEQYLAHIVKMLNIFSHVLEEAVPTLPQIKNVLPNLPTASTLSPIKRKKSDLSDKTKLPLNVKIGEKEDKDKKTDIKSNAMGFFVTSPHYMRMYELVRTAYNSFKITLDDSASENFVGLLNATLKTFSQILEIGAIAETGRIAEEVLSYLKATFLLEATSTVECVQQLLKSLFGSNLNANISEISSYLNKFNKKQENEIMYGFYYNVSQKSYNDICTCIKEIQNANKVECDTDNVVMGYLHRREAKKITAKASDKILASYIRIFEPMVIKSLEQYTITSDVNLQCNVLQLLSQLVQLHVNYCLLDSEQIFIGFVLKQIEFIEEGQISRAHKLIPKIFKFLVQLSYGKQHSKSIISVPKILQLCDGLMASGQSPVTHCIPALQPIIEDIFLLRNKSQTTDVKELETMREVLFSMLLKLIEYNEVIDMLVLILNESKYCDSNDKWLKWSKQVVDVLIPLLNVNKIQIESIESFTSMKKLLFTINPSVWRSPNDIIISLFQDSGVMDDSLMLLNRWLGKIILLSMIMLQLKEETLLSKILELRPEFNPNSIFYNTKVIDDPLNVTVTVNLFEGLEPEVIFLRLLFKTIHIISNKLLAIKKKNEEFIVQQLSTYLMCCIYVFQSGNYGKVSKVAMDLLNNEEKLKENDIRIDEININITKCGNTYPLLTFQWCYLLSVLNYKKKSFWESVLVNDKHNQKISKNSLNAEIMKEGCCIIYCDYLSENGKYEDLSWLMERYINLILDTLNEVPVYEFINSLHRNEQSSALIIKVISEQNCQHYSPSFKMKIIGCIENTHSSQVAVLLEFLILKLLDTKELSVSRSVANLASRKIEYLLTLSINEIQKLLPNEKLTNIIQYLKTAHLSNRCETLVSLLNKISTQCYGMITSIEIDQRKEIINEEIKSLKVDKNWYLSQVKKNCSNLMINGEDYADLLSMLGYDDLIDVMNSNSFNKIILKNCFGWCMKKLSYNSIQADTLLKACTCVLLKDLSNLLQELPNVHQVYSVENRKPTNEEEVYSQELNKIFSEQNFWIKYNNICPSILQYIHCQCAMKMPFENTNDLLKFAVLCLESINYFLSVRNNNINIIDLSINCAQVLFKQTSITDILSSDSSLPLLCSSVNSIFKIVQYLDGTLSVIDDGLLKSTLSEEKTASAGHTCQQLAVLVAWIEKRKSEDIKMSNFIYDCVKSLIISLARLPLVNSYILTPPSALKSGWTPSLSGIYKTQVPPIPIQFLQEVDILEEFIFRITLLGWTSRQQFEETWMCFLSVLSPNPDDYKSSEEISHASSLAVQAITSLLIETLCEPVPGNRNVSNLIHIPRDLKISDHNASIMKLKSIHNNFETMYMNFSKLSPSKKFINVFNKANLEKVNNCYSYGQVSVEYLAISSKIVDIVDENCSAAQFFRRRQKMLQDYSLDLNSCIQFLLDFYSQWIKFPSTTPLRILQEVLKSVLLISDLFTEKSQFSWMLESFMELYKSHTVDDELLHQYFVIGICKSASILLPDMETQESIKKILTQSLKSAFLPTRIASLHGILYILQGCVLGNTVIGGVSEEMKVFLPLIYEYIHCNSVLSTGVLAQSQEHSLLLLSLSFYVIENIDERNIDSEFVTTVIQDAIKCTSRNHCNTTCYNAIMKGLERLVIKKCLSHKLNNQILTFALNKMKNSNQVIALPATQLLLTCMYTECAGQLQKTESNEIVQSNPDNLVQTLEKVSAIFDKIKRGYLSEVELLCSVLPTILNDFFSPADILTKVISEFLSPQQRHPKLLSRVVFQVFDCAIKQQQLLLLQDWVVFSLSNFIQLVPIGMATWCLTCFFISATTNEWLRSLFPIIQSRIGRYEYEDRKMLCIAAADFYHNLSKSQQKQAFVETFDKVKEQPDTPYKDLLASL